MTRRMDINARVPMVKTDRTPTTDTTVALQEIVKLLRDLEARVEALETP